jgi:hypothetical protein
VLAILREHPNVQRAVVADDEADPNDVIIAVGIRNVATCELRIPRDKYYPFLLLDLIARHGVTAH